MSGIDQLGLSMLIAAVVATAVHPGAALPAFTHPPGWLGHRRRHLSSVIP
jgi:hypothetical protein